jgi:transposase InsO family protein
MRAEFVRLALAPGANKRELMRRFNISPPTGYKWIRRFEDGGIEDLEDKSRRPTSSPNQSSKAMEKKVVDLRMEFPFWGGRKLARVLKNRGVRKVPSPSTVTAILRRHGLLTEKAREKRDFQRFEREKPNELWQMDFKGDFAMRDSKRCYPLTLCDDHSRFNVVLEACLDMKTKTVRRHLSEAFERYGLPDGILCDNGAPWSSNWTGGYTKLEVWLMILGVRIHHGRPYHPQTQGKEERFHKTLKVECLDRSEGFANQLSCQKALETWRECYNWVRPHDSLELEVPGSRYVISSRSMPSEEPKAEQWYLEEDDLRKVQKNGIAEFKAKRLQVGEAFAGQVVALRPRAEGQWEMRFASTLIGIYDLTQTPQGYEAIRPLPKKKC